MGSHCGGAKQGIHIGNGKQKFKGTLIENVNRFPYGIELNQKRKSDGWMNSSSNKVPVSPESTEMEELLDKYIGQTVYLHAEQGNSFPKQLHNEKNSESEIIGQSCGLLDIIYLN